MPTNGFSIKPLKVKLLAGEQKATEKKLTFSGISSEQSLCEAPCVGFHASFCTNGSPSPDLIFSKLRLKEKERQKEKFMQEEALGREWLMGFLGLPSPNMEVHIFSQ